MDPYQRVSRNSNESLFRSVAEEFQRFERRIDDFQTDIDLLVDAKIIRLTNCTSLSQTLEIVLKSWRNFSMVAIEAVFTQIIHKIYYDDYVKIKRLFDQPQFRFFFIESNDENSKNFLFWSHRVQKKILGLKFVSESEKKISHYMRNYLLTSLADNEHHGPLSNIKYEPFNSRVEVNVSQVGDTRSFNLLSLASESGNNDAINATLKYFNNIIKYHSEVTLNFRKSISNLEEQFDANEPLLEKTSNDDVKISVEDEISSLKDLFPIENDYDATRNLDNISLLSRDFMQNYRDDRGFNLLMQASEAGHVKAVEKLIQQGEGINLMVGNESAINLAYNKGNHDIVLMLLKANAAFPPCFNKDLDLNLLTDELKNFIHLCLEMHEKVRKSNERNFETTKTFLKQKIEANPTVQYFFDLNNCSLCMKAFELKKDELFTFLMKMGLNISPFETFDRIIEKKTIAQKKIDDFSNIFDIKVREHRDHRGFDALMIASESNRIDEVRYYIEKELFIPDRMVNFNTAASLALKQGNFEILLMLLKAGSEIPYFFNSEEIDHEGIQSFCNLLRSIHEYIEINNAKEVERIIKENPNLRFFYDFNNRSAFRHAIESKRFEIYKILVENFVTCGPYERFNKMLENLDGDERSELDEIQLQLADPVVSPVVFTLMAHSFVGCDSKNIKRSAAMEAFNTLLHFERVEMILKVIAMQKNYQIVFDFTRDTVQYVNPSSELYMTGKFESSGQIFVAAKKLFDEEKKYEVLGCLAHELCHFAMYAVFKNLAKPYRETDKVKELEFKRIVDICEPIQKSEELIRLVYAEYDSDWHPTELIVRPVQIDVQYCKETKKLEPARENFKELYEFYDNTCMPEMENIGKNFLDPLQKISKLKRYTKGLMILVLLLLLSGLLALFIVYDPVISWAELSAKERQTVKKCSVSLYGVDVKLGEIFAEDSKVYDMLSSEQLKEAFKNKTENLSSAINMTLYHHVILTWSNMTEKLREKFLTMKINFQGEKISIGNLTKNINQTTLNHLESKHVREIFEGRSFRISLKSPQVTNIYVERFFIDHNKQVFSEKYCRNNACVKNYYRNRTIDREISEVKNFTKVIHTISHSKLFVLSSFSGDGKTTAFRHFSLKLKEKYPHKWIQFVDLKKHINAFKEGQNLDLSKFEDLSIFLGKKLLELKGFEFEIFKQLLASSNVIFLWDGFDEISSENQNFLLDKMGLMEKVLKTNNSQFVSTRPQYASKFKEKFNIEAHKLIPFSELDRFELLIKTIAADDFKKDGEKLFEEFKIQFYQNQTNTKYFKNNTKFSNLIQRANDVFEFNEKGFMSIENDNFLTNPLLISIVLEIYGNQNLTDENEKFNCYKLYDDFTTKKRKMTRDKGENVQNDMDNLSYRNKVNIFELHQLYALKEMIKLFNMPDKIISSVLDIEERIKNSTEIDSLEQVSRIGILQVTSEKNFTFPQLTFAEFFVAEYFINNLLKNIDDATKYLRSGWESLILLKIWRETKVKDFIDDYLLLNKSSEYKHFDETKLKNPLVETIKASYSPYKNHAFIFVRHFPEPYKTSIGFPALCDSFDEKEDKKGKNFRIFLLAYMFGNDVSGLDKKGKNKLEQKQSKAENLVGSLTEDIIGGLNTEFKKFANDFYTFEKVFKVLLPKIIQKAYSNDLHLDKFENILESVRDFRPYQKVIWYHDLFNQIKKHNNLETHQLIMLSYRFKLLTEDKRFKTIPPTIPQYYIEITEKLQGAIPINVYNFTWNFKNGLCTVETTGKYFDPCELESSNSTDVPSRSNWKFVGKDNVKSFQIVTSNLYLYAPDKKTEYCWSSKQNSSDERYLWQLIPKEEKFDIINLKYKESTKNITLWNIDCLKQNTEPDTEETLE